MIEIRCHTNRYGIMSKTIDGSAWFEQASTDDVIAFLDDRWQGNTGHSFAAYDFLEFYKDDALAAINGHLEANSDEDISVLMDIDPEQGMAWFEENRPDVFEELSASQQTSLSYA
ncbi:hypothetical protein G6L37_02605 [Agrobacterium rubi]|nr:hypothetical protein [Agrobacterium rubi]NTF24287.1 hypothetical protein [Agrobacterium rubi]